VKETICASGMAPLEVTKAEDCCKQFVCGELFEPIATDEMKILKTFSIPVPVTTPRPLVKCPDPQIPTCTVGQIKKTIVDADGCQQIICGLLIHLFWKPKAFFFKIIFHFLQNANQNPNVNRYNNLTHRLNQEWKRS
jgi:hypothetical protein